MAAAQAARLAQLRARRERHRTVVAVTSHVEGSLQQFQVGGIRRMHDGMVGGGSKRGLLIKHNLGYCRVCRSS